MDKAVQLREAKYPSGTTDLMLNWFPDKIGPLRVFFIVTVTSGESFTLIIVSFNSKSRLPNSVSYWLLFKGLSFSKKIS